MSFRQACVSQWACEGGDGYSASNRVFQNTAYGCSTDLQPSGDLGFAYAGAVKIPDLIDMKGRCFWPTQPLAVPSRVLQTCAHPFAQNLSFKLRKDCQQTGHRPTGWRCQIQCLRQRYETDPQIFQFLQGRQHVRD